MKLLVALGIIFLHSNSFATFIETSIYEIDVSKTEDIMVKAETGEVLWPESKNKNHLLLLQQAYFDKVLISVEVDLEHKTINLKLLNDKISTEELSWKKDSTTFEPTVFTSYSKITNSFLTMRRDSRKRSQCYERAYVWAYDLWSNADNVSEYVKFQTGIDWSIEDQTKIVITTPKYIGYQLGRLRLEDEGRTLWRAKTVVEDRYFFERIGLFDDLKAVSSKKARAVKKAQMIDQNAVYIK